MADLSLKVASSEVARDINRRIVLNLIRTRQPISRADLARASGLQRSTISLIVEDLLNENWVVEGPTGRPPRGRRPTFLRLNEDRVIVGIDLRPGNITLAVGNVNGKLSMQEVLPTPADPRVAVEMILRHMMPMIDANSGKKVEGVGITIPGRAPNGRLAFTPNLRWADFDISRPIAKATGLDVEMENAANACVLASVWFDRLASCQNLVVVTVSEGIGAGLLLNGQLARGRNGMAGEFGHVPLELEGPQCGCGSKGCWEVFASNRAALRYYRELTGGAEVTFTELMNLADAGDEAAIGAMEKMARYLGRGMRMIVAGLAPERILVIGDITRSWERFGPIVEAEVAAQVLPGSSAPLLTPVHEGGMARMRGTIAIVLQKDFGVSGDLSV